MSNDFCQETVEALHPFVGGLGVGAIAGAWANLENTGKVGVMVQVDAAAEALTLTLAQATDTSGTGTKELQVRRVYKKLDTDTVYTLDNETAAADYTIPASEAGIVIVEVDEADLDINNNFNSLQASLAGSTARVQAVIYLLRGPAYKPAGASSAS